jgi:hypothetical protein
MWLILDVHNFALQLSHKASGGLYRMPSVERKHSSLTHRITAFGYQKWDADHKMRKISEIIFRHGQINHCTTSNPVRSFGAMQRYMRYYYSAAEALKEMVIA